MISNSEAHYLFGLPMQGTFKPETCKILFGMGCFWGVERMFWKVDGVVMTAVGYSAGITENPTYETVCGGKSGHNEVVMVHYNPENISFTQLLKIFWEGHNPTQGMRQGNDIGTQYRSGIYTFSEEQARLANLSRLTVNKVLKDSGFGETTTEIFSARKFYYAEKYHQQYLAKNTQGYCGLGGLGISHNFNNLA